VTPQTNQEELRGNLFLKSRYVLNDLVLESLGNLGNTLENTGQLTNSKQVMELGWSRKQTLTNSLPNSNSSINKKGLHVNDILSVLFGVEEGTKNGTVNISNRLVAWRSHIDREELALKTVGNVVTTTTGMVHSSQELHVHDSFKVTTGILIKEVETL